MPTGSAFFDAIVRQPPLNEELLNPEDNLEEFGPISETELEHLSRSVREAAATGRAVTANFGGTAFGDIALVPAPFLKDPKGIRDVTEWYVSTRSRRDYIHKVFESQCEFALQNLARIHQRVGNSVDAVFVCGTDFGTQTSAFCSVPTFRELWFPYYKRVNDWIHANTTWKTFKHSCGSVARFFESFIEAGFDIANPVQCSATGMDPAQLKREVRLTAGVLGWWRGHAKDAALRNPGGSARRGVAPLRDLRARRRLRLQFDPQRASRHAGSKYRRND